MKLTTDRHEASRGLFATAELLVLFRSDEIIIKFGGFTPVSTQNTAAVAV